MLQRQSAQRAAPANGGHAALRPARPEPDRAALHPILQLQQSIGNQAVARLLAAGRLQPMLRIGQPGDRYEREADRVADEVMRSPGPVATTPSNGSSQLQRKCAACATGQGLCPNCAEEEKVQRKPLAETITPLVQRQTEEPEEEEEEALQAKPLPGQAPQAAVGVESQLSSLRGGGQPLPDSVRAFFEPRFGADFSHVRVHTGAQAAESAQAVNARAFTLGRDIAFAPGEYAPGRAEGQRLLAHELTHTVQQRNDPTASSTTIRRQEVEAPTNKCDSTNDSNSVVKEHKVEPDTIEKAGDKVKITVMFACKLRGDGVSKIVREGKDDQDLPKHISSGVSTYAREWDGMESLGEAKRILVDDGTYVHKLDKIKYAFKYNPATKKSDDLFATGDKLVSPPIKVKAREYQGSGAEHFHYTEENVKKLAIIIKSEMGVGNTIEKEAIAWAVRNQMIRVNTGSVEKTGEVFSRDESLPADETSRKIAREVLKQPMSNDITGGAIKWFSPQSMYKAKDKRGGLITVTDTEGKERKVYSPSWRPERTFVRISGVRDWFARFYKL